MRSKVRIGPGEILPVVAGKVEVMQCVMSWSVDEPLEEMTGNHIPIMNEDGPKLDKDEETEVEVFVQGKEEHKGAERVSDATCNSSKRLTGTARIERNRREGGMQEPTKGWALSRQYQLDVQGKLLLTDPLVVGLVDVLVDRRVVLPSVNPVNPEIGKHQVKSNARDQVRPSVFVHVVVHFALSSNLTQEPRERHDDNDRRSDHR